jgi:primosomal protein N' (replication factor Y)
MPDPAAQALVMVPEINLTPSWKSALPPALPAVRQGGRGQHAQRHDQPAAPQKLAGRPHRPARIVLGTRMAVFASLPRLR